MKNRPGPPAVRRLLARALVAVAGVVLFLTAALWVGAADGQPQVLRQHIPAAVAQLPPTGRLLATKHLRLAIGLPLRNEPALNELLGQLADPASPQYRHYLTPEQFAAQFGPTEQDYQAVIAFANAHGLAVTAKHPNRVVLGVEGTVGDIERAFHLTLREYRHPREARTFYAPDTEPSLDLAVPILRISGLDDYAIPRPLSRIRPLGQAPAATPNAGSGPGGSYRGNDFRAAYVPGTTLTGAGQTVGLVQFDGFYASDIAAYASQTGLPNIPLQVVPIDGGVSTPGSGNSEVCLDIEMVMAMAPGLTKIIVYEAPNPSPWVDILSRMANDNLAKQLSCSWGGGPPDATAEQIFRQMAAQGQTFFNATGDSDAFTGSISFPSDSTNIVEVGGTTLATTGPGGTYVSETVWNWGGGTGSSGGISTFYSLPFYQQGLSMAANQGSTTKRNVPDVALTADNIYVTYNNGGQGIFGGTSCAAPLWAAYIALVNQQAAAAGRPVVGFINPAVYTIGKSAAFTANFHDITTGNNFSSASPTKFSAVTGYDLCTGWGTPNGTNLINALAGAAVLTPTIAAAGATLAAEGCAPTNGVVDPNETVTISFSLMNTGTGPASNVVATLQTTGGVTAPSAPQSYGLLAAGGAATARAFTFSATGSCGATLTATLQIQDGATSLSPVTFSFPLGALTTATPLAQGFDSVATPALPAGWTSTTAGRRAQIPWVTTTAAADTAPNAAFAQNPSTVSLADLMSPTIPIASATATLTFRHNYNLETGYDGGVLEIKIGSGAFTDILAAGGSFVSGGYNVTINSSFANPLAGRAAWSGPAGGFLTTVVNLPAAAAGQTVQFKWRCGSDTSVGAPGWYVDTVSVADGTPGCCTGGAGLLAVAPITDLLASGPVGGPFSPAAKIYTLTNSGTASLTWSATKSAAWIDLSATAGTLAPGAAATVTVTINSNANGLAAGGWSDTVTFSNLATGTGTTSRGVNLTITAAPPVAGFTGTPTNGSAPLTVTFTDQSTGSITNRLWSFGDSATSTNTNPAHTYPGAGTYTVALTAAGPAGANTQTRSNYVTVIVAPPATPTGLAATAGNANVALSWAAAAGAASYNVKRATVSGGPYGTIASGVTTTNYLDTAVVNSTPYYYVVAATNPAGSSANSAQVSATPLAPPAAPTGLAASANSGTVVLNWSASPGATSYNLKRATVSGGPYSPIASGVTATNYPDAAVVNGTTYYYVVTAVNTGGESPNSTEAPATPGGGGLPSPWQTQDLGAVGVAGAASFTNGAFTVTGSGTDIGGNADQCRYVYQLASGDCEILARVDGVQVVDASSEVGVMIRESLNPDARMVLAAATPGNGTVFQQRTSTGAAATSATTGGLIIPYWVRLVRSGNTFTAYRSLNGSRWGALGSVTINMGATVYLGLAVTSHANPTLCTAILSNVTVVP